MNAKQPAILVVDDQDNWRDLIVDILEEDSAYTVVSKSNYEDAKNALLKQDPPFHAAVVDIRLDDNDMANEDGLDFIAELNRMGDYTNAIVVTGYPTIQTTKRAIQNLAAYDYLEKYPSNEKRFNDEEFLKIVKKAVEAAESNRPEGFVRKGKRILILERDKNLQKLLVTLLESDDYEIETAANIQNLFKKLKTISYNLIILNASFSQDRDIIQEIKSIDASPRIILLTDAEISGILRAIQDREIFDVVKLEGDQFSEQRLRETVRRSFSPESTKYVTAGFIGVGSDEALGFGKTQTLALKIKNNWENEALQIWLPAKSEKQAEVILRISIYAPGMGTKASEDIYWTIPAVGKPEPLEIDFTPSEIGNKRLIVDIEDGQVYLGRLEKTFMVVKN